MMSESDMLDVRDLPETLWKQPAPEIPLDENLVSLTEMHQNYIRRVLRKVGGNKTQAAKILGINRATLYRFLKESAQQDDSSETDS